MDEEQTNATSDEYEEPKQPRLGLATTRELLQELKARGETTVPATIDSRNLMYLGMSGLMRLGQKTLDYRTTDGTA